MERSREIAERGKGDLVDKAKKTTYLGTDYLSALRIITGHDIDDTK
jgi:hypothetical protein